MVRVTMPSRSRPRSVTVSILAVMPSMALCSSVNRMVPWPSRSMAYIDHLSPTRWRTSRARQLVGSLAAPVSLAVTGPAPSDGTHPGSAGPVTTTFPPAVSHQVTSRTLVCTSA